MNQTAFVVVIDGGGTKSTVHVYDRSGEIVYANEGLFLNLSVDPTASIAHLEALLNETELAIPIPQWSALVVGLAGKHQQVTHSSLQATLTTRYSVPCFVMRDIDLAKHAYLQDDGIIAIAGTGSIGLGRAKGEELSVGGWGHILGDEGSAYRVSRLTLQALVKRFDQGLPMTETDRFLLQTLSLSDAESIKHLVYEQPKASVAVIAKHLQSCLDDPEVLDRFTDEAEAFAQTISLLVTRLPFSGSIPVHLMGGMFAHNELFRQAFAKALQSRHPSIVMVDPPNPVTFGGWRFAKEALDE